MLVILPKELFTSFYNDPKMPKLSEAGKLDCVSAILSCIADCSKDS